MAAIRVRPVPDSMGCRLVDVPAFPGESFALTIPEAIGDAAATTWFGRGIVTEWEQADEATWLQRGRRDGELTYLVTVTATEDTVTVHISLTNESDRDWANSLAFTCFNCGASPSINDHECVRHFVGSEGQLRRLIEVPRRFGPRPAIQLYSVEGGPPGMEIPFVAGFQATPDVTLEGWMAIVARDGKRLVAVVSEPPLFLFQNMEYSCIHSCPSFGAVAPGQTGEAVTTVYLAETTIEEWYEQLKAGPA